MPQNKFEFIAKVGGKTFHPKGFYYQGKYIILVGDVKEGHTIRRKELISDVSVQVVDTQKVVSKNVVVSETNRAAHLGMQKIEIYRFQMESIVDSLRLTSNIHHSSQGKTCFDRGVRQSYEYGKNALDRNIDLHVSRMSGKVEE